MDLICEYSSSEEELEEIMEERVIKRVRSDLPAASTLFKADDKMDYEDPLCHQGRTRGVPHEAGNWATFVSIPYTGDELTDVWEYFSAQYPNYQIQNIEEPHLSLTRTIFLRHHWIDDFVKGVASIAQHTPRFKLRLANFETYTNEEKTRTFIAAKVEPVDNLILLVKKLDVLLNEYGLQEYYKDPSFHISFGWCLGDRSEEIRSGFKSEFPEEPSLTEVLNVQELVCQCAHKAYKLCLSDH